MNTELTIKIEVLDEGFVGLAEDELALLLESILYKGFDEEGYSIKLNSIHRDEIDAIR